LYLLYDDFARQGLYAPQAATAGAAADIAKPTVMAAPSKDFLLIVDVKIEFFIVVFPLFVEILKYVFY
jgi:hypothetical protein